MLAVGIGAFAFGAVLTRFGISEQVSYRAVRLDPYRTVLLHPQEDRPIGVKVKGHALRDGEDAGSASFSRRGHNTLSAYHSIGNGTDRRWRRGRRGSRCRT